MQHKLNAVRKTLLVDDKPEEALELIKPILAEQAALSPGDKRSAIELAGLGNLKLGKYEEASGFFAMTDNHYLAGYSHMLGGSMDKASLYWRNLLPDHPNHWCLSLHGMLTGTLNALPTFLQIRNHVEADLQYLYRAKQSLLAESLLLYVDILSDINYECYKFVGRSLYYVGEYEKAGTYLLKGQKLLPNDPEVYYHLGQYYHAIGQDEESILMLQQCILISPTYTPAIELRQKLTGGIQSR